MTALLGSSLHQLVFVAEDVCCLALYPAVRKERFGSTETWTFNFMEENTLRSLQKKFNTRRRKQVTHLRYYVQKNFVIDKGDTFCLRKYKLQSTGYLARK